MEAASILGCSIIELRQQPDKHDLMCMAFTYRWGCSDGKKLMEANPKYRDMVKAEQARQKRLYG